MRTGLLSILIFIMANVCAQENNIPIGAWRLHLHYANIKSLAEMEATGIYLVFSTSAAGLDKRAGKIAIVE